MERDTGAVVSRLGALGVAGCGFEKGPGTEDRDGGLWKVGRGRIEGRLVMGKEYRLLGERWLCESVSGFASCL